MPSGTLRLLIESISVPEQDREKLWEIKKTARIGRAEKYAAVTNARVFREIQKEYGSFADYLWHWTEGKVIYETGQTSSKLSDSISRDLKKRGMKFAGTTVIYAYLQAVGVIYSHEQGCFLMQEKNTRKSRKFDYLDHALTQFAIENHCSYDEAYILAKTGKRTGRLAE